AVTEITDCRRDTKVLGEPGFGSVPSRFGEPHYRPNLGQSERVTARTIKNQSVIEINIHWNPGEEVSGPVCGGIQSERRRVDGKSADLVVPWVLRRIGNPNREGRIVFRNAVGELGRERNARSEGGMVENATAERRAGIDIGGDKKLWRADRSRGNNDRIRFNRNRRSAAARMCGNRGRTPAIVQHGMSDELGAQRERGPNKVETEQLCRAGKMQLAVKH